MVGINDALAQRAVGGIGQPCHHGGQALEVGVLGEQHVETGIRAEIQRQREPAPMIPARRTRAGETVPTWLALSVSRCE